jgi:hypothetical protein
MPSINDIIANFQGGARANRYRVLLTFPFETDTGVSLNASIGAILGPLSIGTTLSVGSASYDFQFMCKSASLPPSVIGTIEVPYQGRTFKIAGDRTFPDWSVNVTNDETFSIRDAFERWMNAINSHVGNTRTPTTNAYFSVAQVQQLSVANDDVLKTYTFYNLFPTEVSDISVGYDQNDSIEEFSVNFSYAYWTSNTTT